MHAESLNVAIRPLASLADFQACVALQHDVWGEAFDAVPAVMLQACTYVGGLVIGAFDAREELVGFVFGLTGVSGGKVIHWSHLLGVRAAARNSGIGRMLKDAQRAELSRLGISEMYWSFDPLIAKNAYLNFEILGARAVRYVPNMYGDTSSPLHHSLPTDRLIVMVDIPADPCVSAPASRCERPAPLLSAEPRPGDLLSPKDGILPRRVWLEIPTDFALLISQTPDVGRRWHAVTRDHFEWAASRGYEITGFRRDPISLRSFYTLELSSSPHPPRFDPHALH